MRWFRASPRWAYLALACLGFFTGCYSERPSDPLAPGGSSDPFGEGQAQFVGLSALAVVNDLVVLVPEWTAGRMGGIGGIRTPEEVLSSAAPAWDDGDKGWVFSDSLIAGDISSPSRFAYRYAVHYSRCRVWQREARGADEMGMRIELLQDGHGESPEGQVESYTFDYHYRYWVNGRATGLRDRPFRYEGVGGMEGEFSLVSGGGASRSSYLAGFESDITLPEDGCPSGVVTIDVEPFTLTATYIGRSTVSWVLKRGIAPVSQGTVELNCGL